MTDLDRIIAEMRTRCADLDRIGAGHAAQPIREWADRLAALAGAAPEPMAWTLIERVRSCGLRRHMTQAMYDANPKLHKWYEPFRCANCHAPAKAREDAVLALAAKWDRIADTHGVRQFTGNDHRLFANELRAALATFAEGA